MGLIPKVLGQDFPAATIPLDGTETTSILQDGAVKDILLTSLPGGGGGGGGDVVGPASSADNAIARYNGTTGKLLQNSPVTVGDNGEIAGYRADINFQTGTTYTVVTGDSGRVIDHANGASITTTLPNNMPAGWCCTYVQAGAGQVTFSAASGATLRNRQSHTKIAGQWGGVTLEVRANSGGSAAEYVLLGDTAA